MLFVSKLHVDSCVNFCYAFFLMYARHYLYNLQYVPCVQLSISTLLCTMCVSVRVSLSV